MKHAKRIMLIVKRAKRRIDRIEKLIMLGKIANKRGMDAFEQACRLIDDADELSTAIIDYEEATNG